MPFRYRCNVVAKPVPVTSSPRFAPTGVGWCGQNLVSKETPAAALCTRQVGREAEEQRRGGSAGRVGGAVDSQHGDVHVAGGIAPGKDTGVALAGGADVDHGADGGAEQGDAVDLGEIDDIGQTRRGQAGRLVAGDAHRSQDGGPVAAKVGAIGAGEVIREQRLEGPQVGGYASREAALVGGGRQGNIGLADGRAAGEQSNRLCRAAIVFQAGRIELGIACQGRPHEGAISVRGHDNVVGIHRYIGLVEAVYTISQVGAPTE